jgi:hypothetical protein
MAALLPAGKSRTAFTIIPPTAEGSSTLTANCESQFAATCNIMIKFGYSAAWNLQFYPKKPDCGPNKPAP